MIFCAFHKVLRIFQIIVVIFSEFVHFIGESMRLEPIVLEPNTKISELLDYYMGNNSRERQEFIIENLREEIDEVNPEEWN